MSQPTTQSNRSHSQNPKPCYDVFLSHHSSDKDSVEELAFRLEELKLTPFLDKWHLVPGDPWQEELEEALDSSATCAVFLGPAGLGGWQNEEMRSALEERVRNDRFRVIPVLLPRSQPRAKGTLPRFLRRLTWVDFRSGLDDREALKRLVAGIRGLPPGPQPHSIRQQRQKFVIVLSGTIDERDRARVEGIAEHLRQISGDLTLTILNANSGSIRLTIESSRDGYEVIDSKFRNGLLKTIAGFEVKTVEDVEHNALKGILIDHEKAFGVPFPSLAATLNYLGLHGLRIDAVDLYDQGLTPASLLAQSMFDDSVRSVADGVNLESLKRGIRLGITKANEAISKLTTRANPEALRQIGKVSAGGNEQVGQLLADAYLKLGREGIVTFENDRSSGISLEIVNGPKFDSGYLSDYFVNDPGQLEIVLENTLILISLSKIGFLTELLPILEQIVKLNRPLLVIAEDVTGEALATLVVNNLRGTLRSVAVKAAVSRGRLTGTLQDLAILTGAKLVDEFSNVGIKDLGTARKVIVTKESTTIIGAGRTTGALSTHVEDLRRQLADAPTDYEREFLQRRIATLTTGVGIVRLGEVNNTERKVQQDKIDRARTAVWAAASTGIVPSAGFTLASARSALENVRLSDADEQAGIDILTDALDEPLLRAVELLGISPKSTDEWVRFETTESLVRAGAIDPANAVSAALESAALVATSQLSHHFESRPSEEQAFGGKSSESS